MGKTYVYYRHSKTKGRCYLQKITIEYMGPCKEHPFVDKLRGASFTCELCGRGFKQLSERDLHIIREHGARR